MSDTETNGTTDLDAILAHISPEHREAFLRSRLRLKKFSEDDEVLAIATHLENFAVVIGDLLQGGKGDVAPATHHPEDLEAARAEITHLSQTVRGVGESMAKMERRFTLAGDSLTKIEDRLKALNEITTTFAGVARQQLYWLCAVAFGAGAALAFGVQMFCFWISTTFH